MNLYIKEAGLRRRNAKINHLKVVKIVKFKKGKTGQVDDGNTRP